MLEMPGATGTTEEVKQVVDKEAEDVLRWRLGQVDAASWYYVLFKMLVLPVFWSVATLLCNFFWILYKILLDTIIPDQDEVVDVT